MCVCVCDQLNSRQRAWLPPHFSPQNLSSSHQTRWGMHTPFLICDSCSEDGSMSLQASWEWTRASRLFYCTPSPAETALPTTETTLSSETLEWVCFTRDHVYICFWLLNSKGKYLQLTMMWKTGLQHRCSSDLTPLTKIFIMASSRGRERWNSILLCVIHIVKFSKFQHKLPFS